MPRYFFNVMDGTKAQDFDGVVLPNLEVAQIEALKDIAEIKRCDFNSLSGDWSNWSIEICEDEGAVLLVVPFSTN